MEGISDAVIVIVSMTILFAVLGCSYKVFKKYCRHHFQDSQSSPREDDTDREQTLSQPRSQTPEATIPNATVQNPATDITTVSRESERSLLPPADNRYAPPIYIDPPVDQVSFSDMLPPSYYDVMTGETTGVTT